jgi:glucose/arabinose dehydrogenase
MERRTILKAGLTATGALLAPPTAQGLLSPAAASPRLGRVLAANLRVPWGIAFLPSGNALVGERNSGRVFLVRRTGGRRQVGRVPRVHNDGGEGGLLGLAVARTFRRDRWVYAFMSTRDDNRVVRMRYAGGKLGAPRLVLPGIPTNRNHNGGRLAFGPGGLLFASTGDAGDRDLAQDRDSLAGKILRLTPDGEVPRGNPFDNFTWSYGHRNVEGIAFDAGGRLWASEFGENVRDELNRIRRGGNYGWPIVEGGDGPGPFVDPFVTWQTEVCSPSGVAVVGGQAFLGALRGRSLWSVRLAGPRRRAKVRHFRNRLGRIRTVQRAPDGSLWITTSNHDGRSDVQHRRDDRVIRVRVN